MADTTTEHPPTDACPRSDPHPMVECGHFRSDHGLVLQPPDNLPPPRFFPGFRRYDD